LSIRKVNNSESFVHHKWCDGHNSIACSAQPLQYVINMALPWQCLINSQTKRLNVCGVGNALI